MLKAWMIVKTRNKYDACKSKKHRNYFSIVMLQRKACDKNEITIYLHNTDQEI